MLGLLAAGVSESVAAAGAGLDLGRGAIAGALIAGAAFLAGYAAIRRSGLAVCALIMVAMAAALEFSWLGLLPAMPPEGAILFLGLFAAAAIVFLSATVSAAKYNPLLGGVMFTGALILGGLGFINFIDRIDVGPLMRWGAIAVGGFAVILALTQAFRGDRGARLILPGVAMALLAPLVGPLGALEAGAPALAAHGLFTLGVLAASVVVLTEGGAAPAARAMTPAADGFASYGAASPDRPRDSEPGESAAAKRERAEVVIDSQLGRVLDYAGVAIWDWSADFIDQTDSLPSVLGADSDALFTPDAMRQFVHKDDLKKLETEVFEPSDGPFDVALKLFDGRLVRMRGARAAADEPGELERIVAFVELADSKFTDLVVDSRQVQNATRAAIVPAAGFAGAKDFDVGKIVAAFQPIVSLDDMTVVGYEALARLDGKEGDTASLIRAAAHAGKSGEFARSMLDQATAFLAGERKKAKAQTPRFVAMNVSWSQMKDPAFADTVSAAMKKHDLPCGALVLELTEGEAVGEAAAATPVFRKLKSLGAGLAFDDFGAGFSCLSNVRRYDFDYIKVDKSFAEDLAGGGDGAKIVAALARMGRELDLKVIVEGVETEAAARKAAALGCAYGQGYALGRPGVANKAPAKGDTPPANGKTTRAESDGAAPIELTADLAQNDDEKPARWRPWVRVGSR